MAILYLISSWWPYYAKTAVDAHIKQKQHLCPYYAKTAVDAHIMQNSISMPILCKNSSIVDAYIMLKQQ